MTVHNKMNAAPFPIVIHSYPGSQQRCEFCQNWWSADIRPTDVDSKPQAVLTDAFGGPCV